MPWLIDIKPTEQCSLAVIRRFGTLDGAIISARYDFALKEVVFFSNDRISSRVSRSRRFYPPPAKSEKWRAESWIFHGPCSSCETAKLKMWWKSNSSEKVCIICGTSLFLHSASDLLRPVRLNNSKITWTWNNLSLQPNTKMSQASRRQPAQMFFGPDFWGRKPLLVDIPWNTKLTTSPCEFRA